MQGCNLGFGRATANPDMCSPHCWPLGAPAHLVLLFWSTGSNRKPADARPAARQAAVPGHRLLPLAAPEQAFHSAADASPLPLPPPLLLQVPAAARG